jgi:hypothetical protein
MSFVSDNQMQNFKIHSSHGVLMEVVFLLGSDYSFNGGY